MNVTFTFKNFPKSKDELQNIPEISLDTPFKAAALTALVLLNYEHDVNKTIEMLNVLKGPKPLSNYDISFIKDRISDKPYVIKSYFEGTSPSNNYEYNSPLKITVYDNKYSYDNEGYAKLYIQSSGADSQRPIVLREKEGKWYLWENLLLADIRKPANLSGW